MLLHRLVADDPAVRVLGFESDRREFLGRGGDVRRPRGTLRSSDEATGWSLDPILALRVGVELEPNAVRQLAFVTIASGSRESVLETAERYRTLDAIDWVIADAATTAGQEVERLGLDPERLPEIQTLGSLLAFPYRALRSDGMAFAKNRLGQSRLWGLGLSGDLPILLIKAGDAERSGLLRDLICAHQWWRRRGLAVDLVVLRQDASGYSEAVRDRVLELLQELDAQDLLGRRGGLHFVVGDQLPDEDRRWLEVASHVVLDERRPLAAQLAQLHGGPAALPAFTPTEADRELEPTPALEPPSDLAFANGFGGFRPESGEYVIHLEPGDRTPAPWCNVLASETFGTLVTESGGGFTWAGNSGENRLTPWSNDPVSDVAGEALFLRDEETGVVWSPTPAPAPAPTAYQVTHGFGISEWRCRWRSPDSPPPSGSPPSRCPRWQRSGSSGSSPCLGLRAPCSPPSASRRRHWR